MSCTVPQEFRYKLARMEHKPVNAHEAGQNNVTFVAGPGIKQLYAKAAGKPQEIPSDLGALAAAVVRGMKMPAGVRLVLGETLQDIKDASKGLPDGDRYHVQINFLFLRLLPGENGREWAHATLIRFRNNLDRTGFSTLPRNFNVRFVEHTTDENPLVKIVLSFERASKEDVFRFLGAIENAQKQDPNYATKIELANQIGERHSS